MTVANSSGIIPVKTGTVPCDGGKVIPFILDFSVGNQYDLDFTQVIQSGQIDNIQAMYIDNSLNTSPVLVFINGTQQTLTFATKTLAYMPLLTPTQPKLSVSSAGAFKIYASFFNFYIPPQVWAVP